MIRKKLEMMALAAMLSVSMTATMLPVTALAEDIVVQEAVISAAESLTEGTYSVPASLMRSDDITTASMAAACIAGNATVTVDEDGTITATVPIQGITVYGQTAYASAFKVYPGDLSTTAVDAEYTEDEDGHVDSITFTITDKTMDGVYINMNSGMRASDAYIALDYANAEEIFDTEALEAAVSEAEALNEADYTIASWSVLQNALTAAKAELAAPTSQEACDEAETVLSDALEELVNQTGIGSENVVLEAGTYSVPASLMKSDDITTASMAASCIAGNATVTIDEDGTMTATVPIQGITVYGQTAYASAFKVYPGDLSTTAVDTEYTEDEESHVNSITFTISNKAMDGVYLNMNSGRRASDAYLALDYANAQEIISTDDLKITVSQAEDLTEADYTIASWSALQEALTAAKTQVENPTSQKACNEAETALNAAMEALVNQTGIGSENVALEAGVYTVPASLKNAGNLAKDSMAASCIAGDATLTVAEDGTMTATIPVQAVSVFGVTAYANEFKIYAGAVGTDATAAESTTDENGNVNSITFTIPNKAMDGVYVNISVASMNMAPDAFIKLDYASAKKVVNTDALAAAIEAAKALDSTKYTADSWKAVTDAQTAAEAALEAKESQEAVDAAAAALNDAVSALKETAQEPTPVATVAITKGKTYTVSGRKYKVTKAAKTGSTVTFVGITSKKATKAAVPATVKIKGVSCKVTAINSKALKNNKKIKSVTIGSNVTSIGTYAFSGCKNLKKITVTSTKLKTVGKKALSGINKKAVIKVPKAKLKAYTKLFKGKGQAKTVKVTK